MALRTAGRSIVMTATGPSVSNETVGASLIGIASCAAGRAPAPSTTDHGSVPRQSLIATPLRYVRSRKYLVIGQTAPTTAANAPTMIAKLTYHGSESVVTIC